MKRRSITILMTGMLIIYIISGISCNHHDREEVTPVKTLMVWTVDPLAEIPPDSTSYDGRWGFDIIACQGEYESAQIAIRTDNKRVTVNAEATKLLQTLGPGQFDLKNLRLKKIEYLPDEVKETLITMPGTFVLEPHRTQVLRLTVYVPKGTEPTGYHQGVIKLSTGTEEIEVGILVRVRDIEMPVNGSLDLEEFAKPYGMEKLAGICARESIKDEPVNSIHMEKIRDGIDNFQILWLLEQAQIKAAMQQGTDIKTFDPTEKGREVCSLINNKLKDQDLDIGILYKLRGDIIAAIQKTKIPTIDTINTLIVKTTVSPTTPADFAFGTAGRYIFRFNVRWSPAGQVENGDYFRFTFRDIFSNKLTYYQHPIENPHTGETQVILTSENINLMPSSYHVRVDIMRGDQSLSPNTPGACQVYITKEGESSGHMLSSFICSRLAYMWDEKQGIYYHMLPGNLSPTGDPFDPAARAIYERVLRLEINRMKYYDWTGRHPMENVVPEAQHDAGAGILHSAEAYRAMGETDRALFCELAIKRIIEAVLVRKVLTNETGEAGILFYAPRQQQAILLKLLCDTYFYFRDVVGDGEYAQKLVEPIQMLGNYQMAQPNPLGVSEGKVYDGRILVGLSTYCLAENKINGHFDQAHVETVFDFATRISKHTLLHQGWYDDGGMKGHHGYGTMNNMWGLLEARKIALAVENHKQAKLFKEAILSAFDFLARINSSITGYTPQWIPSRHGAWSAGDTYKMLNEIEYQLGENKMVQWYRAHLYDRNIDYFTKLVSKYGETSSLGSRNALTAIMMECEEYKIAIGKN